jgi:hypothetical protein
MTGMRMHSVQEIINKQTIVVKEFQYQELTNQFRVVGRP